MLSIGDMKTRLIEKFRSVYARDPEFIARAPGRIEFIGNHTDYNAGTVLGASIDRGVWVALAKRRDQSRNFATEKRAGVVTRPVSHVAKLTGENNWVNYPLGVLASLPQFSLRAPDGFDYLAVSNLPPGAGLSSSAAIELASGLVFLQASAQYPDRETLVKVAKHAENNFVGVPCGILDQGVSGFGRKDCLVFIDCRGPHFSSVPLPNDAHFWIFNTHTKHALVDGLYAARHGECMEAAKALNVPFLADTTRAAVLAAEARLPLELFKRARHVVEEIARVDAAVDLLHAGDLAAVGKLLIQSHRSSQLLFENSTPELDFLVEALVRIPSVYGARLTGGGFGGAVMALTNGKFGHSEAQDISQMYRGQFGAAPDVLHSQTAAGAEVLEG